MFDHKLTGANVINKFEHTIVMLHIIEHSDWLKLVTWLATSNQSALFQCCIASLHSLQLVKSSMSNVKPNNYRHMFPYTKQGEHQSTVLYEATVRPFKNTYHCLLTFSLSLSLSLKLNWTFVWSDFLLPEKLPSKPHSIQADIQFLSKPRRRKLGFFPLLFTANNV